MGFEPSLDRPILIELSSGRIYVQYGYDILNSPAKREVYDSLEEAQEAIRLWKIKEKLWMKVNVGLIAK